MLDTERLPGAGSEHWTRSAVLDAFDGWQKQEPDRASVLDAEALAYVEYHAGRYARLLEAVRWASAAALESGPLHLLDVGPNVQSALLRRALPGAVIDTLGFEHPAVPPRSGEAHIPFDLNDATHPDRWPAFTHTYDVIVVAEVVEHLHVPAAAVLDALRAQLALPGFVVLQTPNGAALHKRVALLRGRNPIEPPRSCRENPGHLHEYTVAELAEQFSAAGLSLERMSVENYFGSGLAAALYRGFGRVLPATLGHGITACARVRR